MYCVVKLYGDCEPWWFLEGWEEDIVSVVEFDEIEEALAYYQKEWQSLTREFAHHKSKREHMEAFWDPTDQYWCDECDEYLQRFHSLLMMEVVEGQSIRKRVSASGSRMRPCQLK